MMYDYMDMNNNNDNISSRNDLLRTMEVKSKSKLPDHDLTDTS